MKIRLFILLFCAVFLNASLFGFYRIAEEEVIPMQKAKTREDKKKPEKEENDTKDSKDSQEEPDKDSKDKSIRDKIKDKFKKDKEKKEGGRFGDKRF
jgi:hypothetical protein